MTATVVDVLDEIQRRVCIRDFAHVDNRADELVTRASFTEYSQAVVIFERKYGRDAGKRLVVLIGAKLDCGACGGKADKLHIESDTFIPTPAPHLTYANTASDYVKPTRQKPAPKPRPYTEPVVQLRGTNLVWHVIAVNDKRVMAECNSEDDAVRIARALGWGSVVHVMTRRAHEYELGLMPR